MNQSQLKDWLRTIAITLLIRKNGEIWSSLELEDILKLLKSLGIVDPEVSLDERYSNRLFILGHFTQDQLSAVLPDNCQVKQIIGSANTELNGSLPYFLLSKKIRAYK